MLLWNNITACSRQYLHHWKPTMLLWYQRKEKKNDLQGCCYWLKQLTLSLLFQYCKLTTVKTTRCFKTRVNTELRIKARHLSGSWGCFVGTSYQKKKKMSSSLSYLVKWIHLENRFKMMHFFQLGMVQPMCRLCAVKRRKGVGVAVSLETGTEYEVKQWSCKHGSAACVQFTVFVDE